MGTKILGLLAVIFAMAQIGCADGDKQNIPQNVEAYKSACEADATGVCQQRAKVILENPQLAPQIKAVAANALANGGTGAVQVKDNQVLPLLPKSIKTASISDADLKAQALKIQSALEADRNNPRSLHYDPAQDRRPANEAGTAPVTEVAPASVESQSGPAISSTGGGGGEATR